jgi:hypothetical protein
MTCVGSRRRAHPSAHRSRRRQCAGRTAGGPVGKSGKCRWVAADGDAAAAFRAECSVPSGRGEAVPPGSASAAGPRVRGGASPARYSPARRRTDASVRYAGMSSPGALLSMVGCGAHDPRFGWPSRGQPRTLVRRTSHRDTRRRHICINLTGSAWHPVPGFSSGLLQPRRGNRRLPRFKLWVRCMPWCRAARSARSASRGRARRRRRAGRAAARPRWYAGRATAGRAAPRGRMRGRSSLTAAPREVSWARRPAR